MIYFEQLKIYRLSLGQQWKYYLFQWKLMIKVKMYIFKNWKFPNLFVFVSPKTKSHLSNFRCQKMQHNSSKSFAVELLNIFCFQTRNLSKKQQILFIGAIVRKQLYGVCWWKLPTKNNYSAHLNFDATLMPTLIISFKEICK